MIKHWYLFLFFITPGFIWNDSVQAKGGFKAVVEVEEIVYQYESANNGAGPMWCHGNTCIVRFGDQVFASGLETIKDAVPLNNTRWMFFRRDSVKWELLQKDEKGRTREPCPMGVFRDGKIFLSVNPTSTPSDAYNGPSTPEILQFSAQNPVAPYKTLLPEWEGTPAFTEHSYRSFAVDGLGQELILFQNIGYTHAEWAFFNRNGNWIKQGKLQWPWGAEYSKPQPIRLCYPAVQLKDGAVYFLGVSDIIEPNQVWQNYKFKLTGRKWDYDFRRLFYAWSPDIATGHFNHWIEIASREKTAGHIFPCDLWAAPDNQVHVLWTERSLDKRLQKEFFPGEKQKFALNYAIIDKGKVIFRQPIMVTEEGAGKLIPGRGRFHVTQDNRLFVFYYVHGQENNDNLVKENHIVEIKSDFTKSQPVKVDIQKPLSSFFTATIRGGSSPSNILDVFGTAGANTVRYVRIRFVLE